MAEAPFYADISEAPPGGYARWIETADGRRLRAFFWPASRAAGEREASGGHVLVLPGRTEYIEKYGPVAARLAALGYAGAVIDWRGQGLSDREPPYPQFGHVDDFRAYQLDLAALIAAPEVVKAPGKRALLCHSMGGCVGLRALIDGDGVAGAILCSPMWGLRLGSAARMAVRPLARAAILIGRGRRGMPLSGGRGAEIGPENALTSDPDTTRWLLRQITEHRDLALGPPSAHWTAAALREMTRLAPLPSPDIPLLGFLGTDERVVSPDAVRRRFEATPRGELVVCPGARHEILMERPSIQAPVWARIESFLARL